MLGVVVYCFLEKYVCVDYFCLQTEQKILLPHKGFEDTSFYELSVISIPERLLNIVSCCGFVKDNNPTLVLTCRSKVVSYYLSKVFVMLDQDSQAPNNAPLRVKQHIHDLNMFNNDSHRSDLPRRSEDRFYVI